MKYNEQPIFFPVKGYKLFSIIHQPHDQANGKGFIFCHPFAEEKLWSHRVFVSLAREIAAKGYLVMRFDHFGHGDSEGWFNQANWHDYESDLEAACDYLKKIFDISNLSLLGYRLGATLAATMAEKIENIDKLILVDPILDGARYMRDILRINLTTQMAVYGEIKNNREELVKQMQQGETVNVDGYDISYDMFQQITELNLGCEKKFSGKCLIVQVSKKQQPFRKEMIALQDTYSSSQLMMAEEHPFWREIRESYFRANSLTDITLGWMEL